MLFLDRYSGPKYLSRSIPADVTWGADSYTSSSAPSVSQRMPDGKRGCGNIECTSFRIAPWRSRKRPIFEDQWGCSGRCVLSLARAAVRRETANGLETSIPQHRHRLPLGLLMLAQGWITHSQLQHVLNKQKAEGGRIGDWLIAECGVQPQQVTRGLSMQWSCPVLMSRGFMPEAISDR